MPTEAEPKATATEELHFCVLIHGLWGSPGHLAQVSKALETKDEKSRLHILVAKRNIGNFTYDGIELGAERVTNEIEDEIAELEKQGKKVTKFSVVGYSFGGLIARYTIGLLHSKGYFDRIQPLNFTTFATPHLGTRTPLLGWHNQVFNVLGSKTLSASGQQLWTTDDFQGTGRPILAVLADPGSIFIRALASFKHRILYANIVNDRAVPFYTACIEDIDPFVDLDAIDLNYTPGWEDVILEHPQGDSPHTASMAVKKNTSPTYYENFQNGLRNAANKAPFYLFLTTIAPIGATVFLANAGIQSFRSAGRIQEHAEGKSGIDKDKYKVQMMIEGAQRQAEKMMEGMGRHETEEYLPEDSDKQERKQQEQKGPQKEEKTLVSSSTAPKTAAEDEHLAYGEDPGHSDVNISATASTVAPPAQHLPSYPSSLSSKKAESVGFPTLALTPEQFKMKENLDAVGFRKYPVHIKKANHSHAAIVVRMQRPGFGEGRLVARHWAERFEI